MPKRIKFEGKIHVVPDDATPQEIEEILADPKVQQIISQHQPSLWDRITSSSAFKPLGTETGTPQEQDAKDKELQDWQQSVVSGPPTEFSIKHPILAGIGRGLAGTAFDAEDKILHPMTSPAGLAMTAAAPLKAAQVVGGATMAGMSAKDLADQGDIRSNWTKPEDIQQKLLDMGGIASGTVGVVSGMKGIAPKTANKLANAALRVPNSVLETNNPGEALVKEGISGTNKTMLNKIKQAKSEAYIQATEHNDANGSVPDEVDHRFADLDEAEKILQPRVEVQSKSFQMPHLSDWVAGGMTEAPFALMDPHGIASHPMRTAATIATGMLAKKVLGSPWALSKAANFLGNQEPLSGPIVNPPTPAQPQQPSPEAPQLPGRLPLALGPGQPEPLQLPSGEPSETHLPNGQGVMLHNPPIPGWSIGKSSPHPNGVATRMRILKEGQPQGFADVTFGDDGNAEVHQLYSDKFNPAEPDNPEGKLNLGISGTKQLMEQFSQMNPEAKQVGGFRVSGAGGDELRNQQLKLPKKALPQ